MTIQKIPTSGSARRRAKANRNRQTLAEQTCEREGHVDHPTLAMCSRCGSTEASRA